MEDYTELGAEVWDLFVRGEPGRDDPFFRRVLEQHPGPALDVGCGTGRLLLPFLQAGHEVEGVDASADMLAILRRNAAELGLAPVVSQQRMQELDLPRTYRTIFVPCGSFQLVIDRKEAQEALRRFHTHLEPGGLLVLTLYNRWAELTEERIGEWVKRGRAPLPNGTELEKHARVDACHLLEQTLDVTVRYRRLRKDEVIEEQVVSSPERWYFVHELELMLERTGFRDLRVTGNYTDTAANDDAEVLAFFATA